MLHLLHLLPICDDGANEQNSMEYVAVYDIANEEWYTQQTTGDIPPWRMSGCSIVVSAQDESSFSM